MSNDGIEYRVFIFIQLSRMDDPFKICYIERNTLVDEIGQVHGAHELLMFLIRLYLNHFCKYI